MHDCLELTVRDAAWLMSTISDNTATNLLFDKVGIRRPTAAKSMGLGVTTPQSRVAAYVLTKDNHDCRWLIDNEGQLTLAKMGQAISVAWPRRPVAGGARVVEGG
jgi:beta-lactamase class A